MLVNLGLMVLRYRERRIDSCMSKESKGVFWSALDHFAGLGINFILSIILARLIAPSSYGVIAMVQVFLSFAQLFIDSGFKEALIQKTDRKEIDYQTTFLFNLAVAVLLYIIIYFAAPWIADFYEEPILIPLTRVLSLSLIFSSLSISQLVKLTVDLDFKTMAIARVVAGIISGIIGIVCAYKGLECWALVVQQVLSALLTSLLLMFMSRWKLSFVFSFESFKQLFSFGSKLLFTYFITQAYISLTNLLIGKVYTSSDLAYYNRGFNLSYIIPGSVIAIINRVAYPKFCEAQNDKEMLRLQYRKYMRSNVIIIFPLMIITILLSNQIITILLTEKWIETAQYLIAFCLVYITQPLLDTSRKVMLAVGRADITAKLTFWTRFVTFGLLIGTIKISPLAVAIGLILNNFIEVALSVICVKKAAAFSIRGQIIDIIDIIMATAITGAATFIASVFIESVWLSLMSGLIAGITVMLLCVFLFQMDEKQYVVNYIGQIIKKTIKEYE